MYHSKAVFLIVISAKIAQAHYATIQVIVPLVINCYNNLLVIPQIYLMKVIFLKYISSSQQK